jgi:tRNA(Ile)-lysidine synthase
MEKTTPMSDLTTRFSDFAGRECGMHGNGRYLLAVSGGLDSVVLCDLMHDLGFSFAIAHCNFGLRGEESERDESFVRTLAASIGVDSFFNRFDTAGHAARERVSVQEAARGLRYGWFDSILAEDRLSPGVTEGRRPPLRLITAHHADDNIETLLMNLFKGTGISGLRGMLPDNGRVLRPLLFAFREELELYAGARGLASVEDSSNREVKYTRNRVRLQLMPLIEEIFPQARQSLASEIRFFRDTETLQSLALQRIRDGLCERRGDAVCIPVEKLRRSPAMNTVLYDVLREHGFTPAQTEAAVGLMDAPTGKYILSPSHRLLKNRAWIILSPLRPTEEETAVMESASAAACTADGTLSLSESIHAPVDLTVGGDLAVCLDGRDVRFPLLLRRWRKGDYFHPLGMPKKKKVARFLIDRKLSMEEKRRVWVLESDRRILWVVGMRIDDRFKVTPSTKRFLRLVWQPVEP